MPTNESRAAAVAPAGALAGNYALLTAALATLVLGFLALDDQSLWIDELGTWRITLADSWGQWLAQFVSWPSSDAQIPLYHLYMRAWVGLFPATEVSLRAANLPWLFLGFSCLLTTRTPSNSRAFVTVLAVVVFLHPMLWYYANEARPYAMIIAGAAISTSGLLTRMLDPLNPAAIPASNARLIIGTALLTATSIIGMIWSVAFLIPVLLAAVRGHRPVLGLTRANRILAGACALLLLPVAYQYASTVLHGVGATALHENTLQSFASGLYEVMGFGGIGPGREQLRDAGAIALTQYAGALVFFGTAVGTCFVAGAWRLYRKDRSAFLAILVAALLPLALFFILGSVKHWRVLGRHMVPLLFLFSLVLAHGIEELWRQRAGRLVPIMLRCLAAAALLALAVSSLEISHAARHRREDIRTAAQLAKGYLHDGQRTWWVGLSFGADYYGLPLIEPEQCGSAGSLAAVKLEDPQPADLKNCLEPGRIIVERPDTFDREGAVRQYISEHGFRSIAALQGLEVFEKAPPPPAGTSTTPE